MPVIDYQDVLKGLLVQEAMRRQVIRLPEHAPLEQGHPLLHQIQSQRHPDKR